jgi:hypothetical protein
MRRMAYNIARVMWVPIFESNRLGSAPDARHNEDAMLLIFFVFAAASRQAAKVALFGERTVAADSRSRLVYAA